MEQILHHKDKEGAVMLDKDKKEMINKVIEAVQSEASFIMQNKELTPEEKVSQMDVLLDIHHFLRDYEKNIQILNKHNMERRFNREI